MKAKSLVEKAKLIESKRQPKVKIDQDRMELALAWLSGEVSTKQANDVLGYARLSANVLYTIASNLKKAYQEGLLKIIKK